MSLGFRAFLAILLLVGFYLIGLAIAAVLLALPVVEIMFANRIHVQLTLLAVLTALIIIWSLLPRRDRFEAPGPLLSREDHPRLFAELDAVAHSLGDEVPREVYLVPDINAFVANRGGFLGFGSRRVMGLGLTLMQVLSLDQFRAVLAHEYGHYQQGDTALGPLVFRTRQTIVRTVQNLGDNVVNKLLIAYLKLFLRVSGSVSRNQELVADRVSAQVAGKENVRQSLKITHAVAVAYEPYLQNELYPSLNAGGLPPIADGFRRYLASPLISEAIGKHEAEQAATGQAAEAYDSHPSLHERLAALDTLPEAGSLPSGGSGPAVALLSRIRELERRLISHSLGEERAKELKASDWDQLGTEVFTPYWRSQLERCRNALGATTLADYPGLMADPGFELAIKSLHPGIETSEDFKAYAGFILGIGLCVALEGAGWRIDSHPGVPVEARRGHDRIEPLADNQKMLAGEIPAEEWRARLEEWGVAAWQAHPASPG